MEGSSLDYDSDDSLPDLCKLYPTEPVKIKENEIVWAKYHNLYWPSLIRKVFKKDRKVSLWYLDSPKRCYKVPFRNIHSFTDPAFCQNVRMAVSASPFKSRHEEIVDSTLSFIHRRNTGIKDDPALFFDKSTHYLSLYDLKLLSYDPVDLDARLKESLHDSLNENYSGCSDNESTVDSEEENDQYEKLREELVMTDEDYCPEEKVDQIVACIKSHKVDNYLLDVMSHKVPSRKQLVFEEFVKTSEVKILRENIMEVHIKDINKLMEIFKYLEDFYEQVAEKGKWSMFKYVTTVWLPEALNRALYLIELTPKEKLKLGVNRKLFKPDNSASTSLDDKLVVQPNSPKKPSLKLKIKKAFYDGCNSKSTYKIIPSSPVKSSSKKVQSLPKSVNSSQKRITSPQKNARSPKRSDKNSPRGVTSPQKSTRSPKISVKNSSKGVTSPQNNARSPKKSVENSPNVVNSDKKNVRSPKISVKNSRKEVTSPQKSARSPKKIVSSLLKSVKNSPKRVTSPQKSAKSPQRSTKSLKNISSVANNNFHTQLQKSSVTLESKKKANSKPEDLSSKSSGRVLRKRLCISYV